MSQIRSDIEFALEEARKMQRILNSKREEDLSATNVQERLAILGPLLGRLSDNGYKAAASQNPFQQELIDLLDLVEPLAMALSTFLIVATMFERQEEEPCGLIEQALHNSFLSSTAITRVFIDRAERYLESSGG